MSEPPDRPSCVRDREANVPKGLDRVSAGRTRAMSTGETVNAITEAAGIVRSQRPASSNCVDRRTNLVHIFLSLHKH
jgi:hypothetical protein